MRLRVAGVLAGCGKVSVPHALDELRGSLQGSVGLPARLFWSGPNPRDVRWELADPIWRRDLYEIVLVEGTLDITVN
jgi:hypothetical protein